MAEINSNVLLQKHWKGFEFGAPDEDAHPELHRICFPGEEGRGWGALVTPDEIRYIHLAGLELVTQSGAVVTDEMIVGLVDLHARSLAGDLQHVIYPRAFRARPADPATVLKKERHEEWYDLHDHRPESYKNFWLLQLRHRPAVRISRWDLLNPWSGEVILNLLAGADIHYQLAVLRNTRATARHGSTGGNVPLRALRFFGQDYDYRRLPGSFAVDFVAGYENARDVPHELRLVLAKLVTIHILSGFGDSIVSGLANFSISLSSISESVGTTMSATSAYFGARIKELSDELSAWFKANRSRYRLPRISIL